MNEEQTSSSRHAQAIVQVAPGTCGELVQGFVDGQDFLVNCPVDLYSRAALTPSGEVGLQLEQPGKHGKVARAVEVVCRSCNVDANHRLVVDSQIPRGKGMASSTADITAALEAFCRSQSLTLSDRQFAQVLAQVEPSDCVHFPGIAHLNHLTGELFEVLPAPQGLRVLVVDCGGEVDTVSFNRERAREVYGDNRSTIVAALALLKLGLRTGDLRAVAHAATLSAELSQRILFKAPFRRLLERSIAHGALGVNCAHSGTVLGILYREADRLGASLRSLVETHFKSSLRFVGDHRIIAGGRFAA
jgi:L-threonine kinase